MRAGLAAVVVGAAAATACAPAPVLPPTVDAPQSAAPVGAVTESASAAGTEAASQGCAALAASLPLEQQVGQLFMLGVSTAGLDETTRQAISLSRIGSVVLLGNSDAGVSDIRMLTAQLGTLGTAQVPLLVAADQEGGRVQRLSGEGFDDIPEAVEQGTMTDEDLRASAERWGGQLAAAGVQLNLAPVADVVTPGGEGANAPIGALGRHYSTDAAIAAEKVSAFVEGMGAAGIGTSLKHFPGLGRVEVNTDFGAAIDDTTDRDDPSVDVFRAGLGAGADTVMVSSAVFELVDAHNEGVFSETVVSDWLRGDLGFDGVVLADDLGAARSVAGVSPADRAVRFIEAGGDLAINADPAVMGEMTEATLARAAGDDAFAARIVQSAGRVLDLKASLGLMDCA